MRQLRDFSRSKIKEIAEEYANTTLEYTCSYFKKTYGMSRGTFYNLIEKAIIESIVDENTAFKICSKSNQNSIMKVGEQAGARADKHYIYLMLRRRQFRFSKKRAKEIASEYSESSLNKKEFCEKNAISIKLFDKTLKTSIVEGYISYKCFERLRDKAIETRKDSQQEVIDFFENLSKERKNNKRKQG